MKTAEPFLLAYLASNPQQNVFADLLTLTLQGGTALRYTDLDADITTPTNYLPNSEDLENATAWPFRSQIASVTKGFAAPDGTTNAVKIVYTGSSDPVIGQIITTTAGAFAGKTLTISIWAWIDAGQPTEAQLLFYDTTITYVYGSPLLTLTTTPTRYTFSFVVSSAATAVTTWYARFDGPNTVAANKYQYAFGMQVNPGTVQPYTRTAGAATLGYVFTSTGPLFKRSKVRTVLGVQVDTLDLKFFPQASDLLSGVRFTAACISGALDDSTITLERAVLDGSGSVPVYKGKFVNFSGRTADVEVLRTEVRVVVKSDLELLNVQFPRELYQAQCLQTLYDTNCGVNRASYGVSSIVTSSTRNIVYAPSLTQGDSYFDQGYIQFTSGALTGVRRTIKTYAGKTLAFLNPTAVAALSGDTFTVYPGCDKTLGSGGCAKFSNTARFRGMPYIPVPETTR